NDGDVAVLAGDGAGGLLTGVLHDAAGGALYDVDIGDVTGDGAVDLAVVSGSDSGLAVLPGDGAGNFGPPWSWKVPGGLGDVLATDLDADGDADIVVTRSEFNEGDWVFTSLGSGALAPRRALCLGEQPKELDAGDLDGDGLLDLVSANGGFDC